MRLTLVQRAFGVLHRPKTGVPAAPADAPLRYLLKADQTTTTAPLVVTVPEAMHLLSVKSRTTIYDLFKDGALTKVKLNGSTRVLRSSIDDLVQKSII